MAAKKDMRRLDLAIPYIDPPKNKDDADVSGAMSSTLPMAAMFTRNRMIGWVAFVFSLQSWLGETPDQKSTSSTPAYMSVFMSFMALVVVCSRFPQDNTPSETLLNDYTQTYFPIFLPPQPAGGVAAPAPSASP